MTSLTKPRRRQRSLSDRTKILADWRDSGLSAQEYGALHSIAPSTLWGWSSKARSTVNNSPPRSKTTPRRHGPAFVEIPVRHAQPDAFLPTGDDGSVAPSGIEVVCPSGHVLRLRGTVSSLALSSVLTAIAGDS